MRQDIRTKEQILDSKYQKKMHWKSVNRENVLSAMDEYSQQGKTELLNEVIAVRQFFRKGSPLTEMMDKIITKHSPKNDVASGYDSFEEIALMNG